MRPFKPVPTLLCIVLCLACAPDLDPSRGEGATAGSAPESSSDPTAEILEWRESRDASLRKPDGWLSLVGLYWLEEGDNSFGSGAANTLVFPAATEEYAGVLVREGRKVTLLPGAGSAFTIDGQPVSGAAVLVPDTDDAGPTIVETRSLLFHAIERGEMVGIRLKDRESAVLAAFDGMEYFPIDLGWRLSARYELFDEPRVLRTPNVLGTVTDEEISGAVVFEVDGTSHRLLPSGNPEKGFFLVFGDKTNGVETYGGGRFLYTPPVEADGSVVVDFNKAYSPPCVFTPYATCPLPPAENKLAFRIEAGEKTFGAAH